jgi:hypothetical protein
MVTYRNSSFEIDLRIRYTVASEAAVSRSSELLLYSWLSVYSMIHHSAGKHCHRDGI